jgi:hypothetical protein
MERVVVVCGLLIRYLLCIDIYLWEWGVMVEAWQTMVEVWRFRVIIIGVTRLRAAFTSRVKGCTQQDLY